EDRLRDRKVEGLRSLEVDHEIELGRLFDRQIARLRAFQDLIDIQSGATVQVWDVRAVRDQPAHLAIAGIIVDRGQPVPRRGLHEAFGVADDDRTIQNDSRLDLVPRGLESRVDVLNARNDERLERYVRRGSRRLQVAKR